MKTPSLTTLVVTALTIVFSIQFLPGCGGGSSGSSQSSDEIPVNVSVEDLELIAGERTTVTFTVPKPDDPYTEITLDIGRTLEEADISVTPR